MKIFNVKFSDLFDVDLKDNDGLDYFWESSDKEKWDKIVEKINNIDNPDISILLSEEYDWGDENLEVLSFIANEAKDFNVCLVTSIKHHEDWTYKIIIAGKSREEIQKFFK